jgi:hypothetical protein
LLKVIRGQAKTMTILVLGGNFGGMTIAVELRRKLGTQAHFIVASRSGASATVSWC